MIAHLDLWLFAAVCVLLIIGFPVAFTLAGTALLFAWAGDAWGVFELRTLNFFPQRVFSILSNEVVVAVPLFIFMGLMLEKSRVAEDLLVAMARLFGRARGGLALSVVAVGAMMAASTGIVGATVVTMGLIALPVMLKNGYDPRLSTGVICASGTLGQVIPPSIVLVFLGDILTYANQQANLKMGNFAGKSVGVGDLFAGSLLPGLLLVALYALWVGVVAWARPAAAPALLPAPGERPPSAREVVQALVAPAALIVAVLGSILGGIATPTEAAALGAVGAAVLAALRQVPRLAPVLWAGLAAAAGLIVLNAQADLRLGRAGVTARETAAIWASFALVGVLLAAGAAALAACLKGGVLGQVVGGTARITAMVFAVLIGASLFSLVFRGLGGEDTVRGFLQNLPGGLAGAMLFTMVLMFLMGFFLDFLEIIFILVPILGPVLITMGADPVWLGVMIAVNLQTSFLTPPFGFALFFLRGVAPPAVRTLDIYRGIAPFVAMQIVGLAAVAAVPALATWLPAQLFAK